MRVVANQFRVEPLLKDQDSVEVRTDQSDPWATSAELLLS